jgi:nucleotide-binding universal stress UspA family protein
VNANVTNVTGKAESIRRIAEPTLDSVARLKVRHILVPTDFSPISRKALRYARPLAKRFGARITLLHVVAPFTYEADYGYGPVTRCVFDEAAVRAVRRRLGSIARSKCQTTAVVRRGYAPEEIANAARKLKTDLIVIGESQASRAEPNPRLTTAEKTLRNAPCPVVVVRDSGAELLKRKRDGLIRQIGGIK